MDHGLASPVCGDGGFPRVVDEHILMQQRHLTPPDILCCQSSIFSLLAQEQFSYIQLHSVQFSSVQFSSVQFSSVEFQ